MSAAKASPDNVVRTITKLRQTVKDNEAQLAALRSQLVALKQTALLEQTKQLCSGYQLLTAEDPSLSDKDEICAMAHSLQEELGPMAAVVVGGRLGDKGGFACSLGEEVVG